MRRHSRLIRALLLPVVALFLSITELGAQNNIYTYQSEIHHKEATFSGLCIAKEEQESISGTFVNEFGITAFSFIYDKSTQKVELKDISKPFDRWFIRRVLIKDFVQIAPELANSNAMPLSYEFSYSHNNGKTEFQFKLIGKEYETAE